MQPERLEREIDREAWRVLAEIAQPRQAEDGWLAAGLAAAVEALHLPPPVLEPLGAAALEAVARAQPSQASEAPCPSVTVRLLVETTTKAAPAMPGWGFFILERTAGDLSLDEPERAGEVPPSAGYSIDVYLYADRAGG
jgi:hypothetical protein